MVNYNFLSSQDYLCYLQHLVTTLEVLLKVIHVSLVMKLEVVLVVLEAKMVLRYQIGSFLAVL